MASTHATPTCVCRWLLNVSGNTTTGRPWGLVVPPRRANHCCSVIGANVGNGRCRSMPATAWATAAVPGVRVSEFTSSGVLEDRRAAWSMNPKA